MTMVPSGRVVIFSGPSGAGKSTVLRRVLSQCSLPLTMSVSATTRPCRRGEQDGIDYYFLTHEEFARKRERGEFLEYKEVFRRGDWYGTLLAEVEGGLRQGKWVVLEIDVAGMLSAVEKFPDAITIFIDPGSMVELDRRLRSRGTETEASIERRLQVARREMAQARQYQYRVVNRDVEQTVREICNILTRCGENG